MFFLMPHSGLHFLRFWCDLVPKSLILGAPWRPAGHKMPSQLAQVAPKRHQKLLGGKLVEPTCSQGRFRSAPWHHFGCFWTDSEWICMDFGSMFNAFLKHFCNKIRRLPTPPDTKRIDSKHQEHTAICKKMQESDANKQRRHQNSDRYFAIYKMQSAATNAYR